MKNKIIAFVIACLVMFNCMSVYAGENYDDSAEYSQGAAVYSEQEQRDKTERFYNDEKLRAEPAISDKALAVTILSAEAVLAAAVATGCAVKKRREKR